MNNFLTVLGALFKNKFRFGDGASKKSKIFLYVVLGFVYIIVTVSFMMLIIAIKGLLSAPLYALLIYLAILLIAAIVVLIFGIINLVSTLYLSKDTDFYSMLPIKSTTVFAAKLMFVYISELIIVAAIALPCIITFGIVIKAWVWFYIISVLMLVIVPAIPLALAAILAVPVMYIASKLKNRGLATLIFYIVLFGGGFALYIYFVMSSSNMSDDGEMTLETAAKIFNSIMIFMYAVYPYTALSMAVCGVPAYGMSVGASTVVNLLIFLGASVALIGLLLLLGKFMYAKSAQANNQTDSKIIKGVYKTSSCMKQLIKREYAQSLRNTQVAFQCYAVLILPILFGILFPLMFSNSFSSIEGAEFVLGKSFSTMLTFCTILCLIICTNNGAATSYSREGKDIASLKMLPVSGKAIFKAKIVAWSALAVPSALIAVVIVNAINFDLQYFLLSLFSFVPLSAVYVVFGALWDLSAPKLNWNDPRDAVKHNTHTTLGQCIGIGSGFIVVVIFISLLFNGVAMNIISAVCWSLIYAILVIFGIVDIYLYRKVDAYYNRLEI